MPGQLGEAACDVNPLSRVICTLTAGFSGAIVTILLASPSSKMARQTMNRITALLAALVLTSAPALAE
jgi:hypothetical protein